MSKQNALERVEKLEAVNKVLSEQIVILAEEIDSTKAFLGKVVEKMNLMISVFEANQSISHDLVNKALVTNEASKLNKKTEELVKAGILEATDLDIQDDKFVVGRELSESKEVIDEVVQFAMSSLPDESKEILRGHKKGDLVKIEKSGTYIEVIEVYNIKQEATNV